MTARLSAERRGVHVGPPSKTSTSNLHADHLDLVNGTGQWQNMQEVLRSTIKALLDAQAEHQQQIAAHEKQIRHVQALLHVGSRKLPPEDKNMGKACREEAARATAKAAETAAGLSKLREDVSAAREDTKAEANDLLARVENKASKDHVKACLDGKASLGELTELRGRMDRLAKREGLVEPREVDGLREQALKLENRVVEMETRVRGCEAHAVRADPVAVALRIETVSSRLEELSRRVDHKASAKATERALEQKVDKSLLRTALGSKADRSDLKVIETSAASLLDSSRERAAMTAALERKAAVAAADVAETATSSAAAATAALGVRADGHDKALARLSTKVADAAAAAAAATATAAAAERVKSGGRCGCEKELRRAGRRLERVEGGLSAVATASSGAIERATKTADALEERCRKRAEDEVGAVADAVDTLAERVQEWEPSRHLEAVQQLVDGRVKASAKESTARAAAALAERLSTFERQVQNILSEFSHGLASQGAGAGAGAAAAAAAAAMNTLPARRRQETRVRHNGAGWDAVPPASSESRVDAWAYPPVASPKRDPTRRRRRSPGAGASPRAERRAHQGAARVGRVPEGRREGETGGHRRGDKGRAACAVSLREKAENRPRRPDSASRTGAGEEAGTHSTTSHRAVGAFASSPRPVAPVALAAGKKPMFSSSSCSSSLSSPSPPCFPLRSPALSASLRPALPAAMGTAATAAERAAQGGPATLAASSPERSAARHVRSGTSSGTGSGRGAGSDSRIRGRSAEQGGQSVRLAARRPEAAAALEATRDRRPHDPRREKTARRRSAPTEKEGEADVEVEVEGEEWTQAGVWAAVAGELLGQRAHSGSSTGRSGRAGSSPGRFSQDGGVARRIEELRRQKEAYREVATRALYA